MLNRRNFLKTSAAAAAAVGVSANIAETKAHASTKSPAPRNPRPYSNVDWDSAIQIYTTTHGHVTSQSMLNKFLERDYEFLTISNYYPSAPYYPMSKMTRNYYRVHHDHPVMYRGELTDGPFDWNAILKPWVDTLEEKFRSQYPFEEGGPLFTEYPADIMQAPNAEHHSFSDTPAHICAPGSLYASGTFDARDFFKTKTHGYHFGVGLPWRTGFDNMLNALLYEDGGGVTINHPAWSHLKQEQMLEMLDYDPRVLGIEVFNDSSELMTQTGWSEHYWDHALGTGRQCFGFFVPDWHKEGVNVLLIPERNAHECLKAYRQGNWYGALKGGGILRFRSIRFDGKTLTAKTDKTAKFQIIAKTGVVFEQTAEEISFTLTNADCEKYVYLRLKAYATDDSGEILFSQPIRI